MALVVQNGALLKEGDALASGQACCCNAPCPGPCQNEIPQQITLSLAGMGNLFWWSSRSGGFPGIAYCGDANAPQSYEPFCGECGGATHDISLRRVGIAVGAPGYSGHLVLQDFEAVLDRDECELSWSGYAPVPPAESRISGAGVTVDCGGGLSYPLNVSISTVELETTVEITAPTKDVGGETATAEATISEGGQITAVTLLTPGSGYAREILERSAPDITATVSGGSGATLTVTITENDNGGLPATWSVSAVSVVDGGTGYEKLDAVTFTPEEGATTLSDASAFIIVGLVEPTVTASATGGTGADLAVTLSQETDEFGDKYWTVLGVDVIDGGTGYTDGDPVTFAVTDGTSEFSATGYIVVTDGEITAVEVAYSPYYPYESGYYYKSTGVIESVVLTSGSEYYVETPTGTSEVDTPSVLFRSASGVNATATATVDGTVGSATFGQITGITVTSGGQNYRASGTGYLLTITMGQVSMGTAPDIQHLHTLLGNETPPEPNAEDAQDCANFFDKKLPIASRVSFGPCPSELLQRSYPMSVSFFSIFSDPAGDGLANAVWCKTPGTYSNPQASATFYEFGNGEITCTISPA